MKRILLVFGTRPEAVKMCPLVQELNRHGEFDTRVCLTGQHREMLLEVMDAFSVKADYNLDIMQKKQSLSDITTMILKGLDNVMEEFLPDIVLVHGDTTSSLAAALSAFYHQIPVGHVEAGLRSNNIYSPYPEEMNRLLVDRISSIHFAPTKGNRDNLIKEGISGNVFVTGNTGIDALAKTIKRDYVFHSSTLNDFFTDNTGRVILLTAHRRENLGLPLENICRAVLQIIDSFSDVRVIYPVHRNPAVRETVFKLLGNNERIYLTDPVDVFDMHNLITNSYIVMTDSGGLQEEAPALGKPVIVLRTETERPEAVAAGTVKVAGVDADIIFRLTAELLESTAAYQSMANAVNPYGDGHASERIARHLLEHRELLKRQE